MAKGDNKENNRQKTNIGTKRTETGQHQEKNTRKSYIQSKSNCY